MTADRAPDPHASTDAPSAEALAGAKAAGEGIVVCDACPVLCRIRPGRTGACDRYANLDGRLTRTDPFVVLQRTLAGGGDVVRFSDPPWNGALLRASVPLSELAGAGADSVVVIVQAGSIEEPGPIRGAAQLSLR